MKKFLFLLSVAVLITSFSPRPLTWVAIGDSITYLNDHTNETGNRVTKGYMTRVVEKLPNIQFTNQGHNGWTVVKIAQSIEKLGLQKADIYSVLLGTNDWWYGSPLGTWKDYENNTGTGTAYGAFRIIIDKLHGLNKNATLILMTPMQRADFVYINNMKNNAYGSYREKEGQTLEQFAQAVIAIGKYEHCTVIDLYHQDGMAVKDLVRFKRLKDPQTGAYRNYPYPSFIDVPFNPETNEYPYPPEAIDITYDGLHPSDKGNEKIAGLLIPVLKKL